MTKRKVLWSKCENKLGSSQRKCDRTATHHLLSPDILLCSRCFTDTLTQKQLHKKGVEL